MSEIPARYILVVFWASWVPALQRYAVRNWEKLYEVMRREDFEIVAISVDQRKKSGTMPYRKMGIRGSTIRN